MNLYNELNFNQREREKEREWSERESLNVPQREANNS